MLESFLKYAILIVNKFFEFGASLIANLSMIRKKSITKKKSARMGAKAKPKIKTRTVTAEIWKMVRKLVEGGMSPKDIERKYDIPASQIYARKRKWTLESFRKDPKYAKYHTPVYKAWRKAVFERDHYSCRHCGKSKKDYPKMTLQADHILPQSTHPELKFVVSNGRTLCLRCHKKTPTYGLKALNYRKDK